MSILFLIRSTRFTKSVGENATRLYISGAVPVYFTRWKHKHRPRFNSERRGIIPTRTSSSGKINKLGFLYCLFSTQYQTTVDDFIEIEMDLTQSWRENALNLLPWIFHSFIVYVVYRCATWGSFPPSPLS